MYKLISFDVNGVLTPDLTMAKFAGLAGNYDKAVKVLKLQTSGKKSLKETFEILGKLTQGVSLEKAIQYSLNMPLMKGAEKLVKWLNKNNVSMALNTTGYNITTHILNKRLKVNNSNRLPFSFIACNKLKFEKQFSDIKLKNLIDSYLKNANSKIFYNLKANGTVELGIKNESEKSIFIKKWSRLLKIGLDNIVHIGDSMGDSHALKFVAENKGLGIAFNPNEALLGFIEKLDTPIRKNIVIIRDDLKKVIAHVIEK